MATELIPCKSCGAKIAKAANKCPQCGQSYTNVGTAALSIVGWLAIVVGGLCAFGGNPAIGVPLILIGAALNFGGDALKRSLMK
jgi:hypothetical protein